MVPRPSFFLFGLAAAVFATASCSAPAPDDSGSNGGSGGLDVGSGGLIIGVGGIPIEVEEAPPTESCADGKLDDDEACDDGNMDSGDGCGSNCRYVEPGFVCPDEGKPCKAFAKCGDGRLVFPEQCDDGNLTAGDGCSATCKFEIGFTCDDASPSACRATVCGDGKQEGSETCEAADGKPFDGCSLTCQAEPVCTSNGCTSSCGDGLVIGAEECDDGNTTPGDGCSADCKEEPGYDCAQPPPCTDAGCYLELPIIFRDFTAAHPDFGVNCGAEVPGVTQAELDENGKPVLADGSDVCIQSATTFAEWYTATSNNAEIVSTIRLYPNGEDGYVNRYGPNGEPWPRILTEQQTATVRCTEAGCCDGQDPWNCCEANDTTCRPCSYNASSGCEQTIANVDGNPLFLPIDEQIPGQPAPLPDTGGGMSCAKIPEEVYKGGWKWENGQDGDCSAPLHNFHFTSEIAYWFKYEEGMTANLTFIGDDDVWVFVNRRLAVDLGGLHVPVEGSFTLTANGSVNLVHGLDNGNTPIRETRTVADFGLEDGQVYEIKVFHAERKVTGSSFKLTLSGFNPARSECKANCGDGIVAAGEQCDDGTEQNTGGHNRCNSDCTIGSYCGDGIVQPEQEDCDDADPNKPQNCAGCRILVVK